MESDASADAKTRVLVQALYIRRPGAVQLTLDAAA